MTEQKDAIEPVASARSSHSWLRRTATKTLGDGATRRLAATKTDIDASVRNVLTPSGRRDKSILQRYRNAYEGEQCVIIGNGPSLKNTPLELLKNTHTFGLNRIYLMYEELGFETSFHVVVNQLVVEQCAGDFDSINSPLFTTTPSRQHLSDRPNVAFLNKLVGPRFSKNAAHGIWEGATVTYVAMQLAYYMGFTDVALVGVDHRFAVSGPAHQVVESKGADESHFDPRYFGKGFRWQLPDLETSELAYSLARTAFERGGRRLVDATVDGALQVLPKSSLAAFLERR